MSESNRCVYPLVPIWDHLEQFKQQIDTYFQGEQVPLAAAVKMAASEMIENAVKYGGSPQKGNPVVFEFGVRDQHITMTTRNPLSSAHDLENVRRNIEQLSACEDPRELFVQQLKALIENPENQRTQLGLFRIAYEGEFNLSYHYDDQILTITATRPFPA